MNTCKIRKIKLITCFTNTTSTTCACLTLNKIFQYNMYYVYNIYHIKKKTFLNRRLHIRLSKVIKCNLCWIWKLVQVNNGCYIYTYIYGYDTRGKAWFLADVMIRLIVESFIQVF